MYNSRVIIVTKERHINSLLDDRVSVWTITFPTIQGLLLVKWSQCPRIEVREVQCPQDNHYFYNKKA